MLHYAICDDTPTYKDYLVQQITLQDTAAQIDQFCCGEELLDHVLHKSDYEILILDIEMPNMDGLTLAHEIRALLPDAIIIFLTAHMKYLQQGYEVHAFQYVNKLDLERKFPSVLSEAIRVANTRDNRFITLSNYNSFIKLYHKNIIYAHHDSDYTDIYTDLESLQEKKLMERIGLSALFNQLADDRFVWINRSTFINCDFLLLVDGSTAILKTGEQFPISRRSLAQVRKRITQVLGIGDDL